MDLQIRLNTQEWRTAPNVRKNGQDYRKSWTSSDLLGMFVCA